MGTILKINKLHFAALINLQMLICAAVMLLNMLISVAVIRLADTPGPAGSCDFIAMCWVFIIGLIFFSPSFKYVLSQGISRKTFFLAGNLSIALMAVIGAVLVTAIYIINLKVANVWIVYELIYHDQNLLSLIVWEFAALLFLGVLGWLIRLIYYVSNRTVKLIISIAPFVLMALLAFFNALTDAGMGRAVLDFLKTVMGYFPYGINPYRGVISMLIAAVILCGLIFLLIRRAQVND